MLECREANEKRGAEESVALTIWRQVVVTLRREECVAFCRKKNREMVRGRTEKEIVSWCD